MITVRFPTGFSIQYNSANYAERMDKTVRIFTDESKTKLVAYAPFDAVIEWVPPCRTYNPIATYSDEAKAEITALRKEVRALTRKIGAKP